MANRKFNGDIHISRKTVIGESSNAAKIARQDMQKEHITLLIEKEVFTPEELDELYSYDENEPWWNR